MASMDSILKTMEVYREALRDEPHEEEKQHKQPKQESIQEQKPASKKTPEPLEKETNVVEYSIS